jgi:tRNA threonylcarbamoyladenosine biosynthesis protein TsaB
MNLLAFETATEACSVALWCDGRVLARHELAPRRHAELALPWAEELLQQAGVAKSQLDAIACGRGPGAFTGVRLAVALVQGLGFGLDRPVLGISTLAALAHAVDTEAGGHVVAAIDARMAEVYLGEFERAGNGALRALGEERVLDPRRAARIEHADWVGVGTGFDAEGGALREALGPARRIDAATLPSAAAVAHLAVLAFERGEGMAPERLQPAYLRDRVALTLAEQGKPRPP